MASVNVPVVTFQGGIIGDELQNRVDIPTYVQGAEIVENFRATVQGVMMRRPPMMHVDEFTDHSKQGQLFPFIYSVDESYLVLATEDGFTFYADDDGVITNPTVTASITAAANFTDLADASTITASSTGSGSTANLVDEDSATVWASSAAVSEHLDFDMASAVTLRSIWLTAPTTGANEAPTTFTVKGSATGAFAGEETTLLTVTATTWTAGRRRKWSFTAPGSYRYYRLGMTANGGGASFTLAEVSLFSGLWVDKSETPAGVSIVSGNLVLDGDGGNASILEVPIAIVETNVRHVLAFEIVHGPLDIRIGTTADGYDLLNYKDLRTGVHRLSFTPTTSTVYLQFRHSSMAGRWLKNNVSIVSGGGTFVLPCPYLEAKLPEVHVQQIKDVMYMTHEDYWPRRLERRGASSWSITQNMPNDGPFGDINTTDTQVYPSDTHGEISLYSTEPLFTANDAGRLFYLSSPGITRRRVVSHVTTPMSTDGVKVSGNESTRNFFVTISGSFVGTVRVERSSGTESAYTTDGAIGPWTSPTTVEIDDNRLETLYYRLVVNPADYTSGTITMQLYYPYSSSEGVVRILEYISETEVICEVIEPLGSTKHTKLWKKGDWCVEDGFPVSVSEGYGRLWFARGTRVWASRSDNFTNFKTVTDEADSAFNRNIATPSNDGIKWLAMLGQLAIGTSSMEKLGLGNTNADPIGPSNFQFLPGTEEGGAAIQPVVAAGSILFVHRAKRQLMQFTANPKALSETSYISVDLTARAPEILNDEIVDIAIQREPERRIYVVLANGRLMELLFRREGDVDVVAWSTVPTRGRVERVTVLPRDNEDVAYFIVKRLSSSGTWERHVERFGRERVLMDCDRFHLDSALAFGLTKPATTAEPSATTGSITVKTDADAFVVGDIGKRLWINGGRGTITAYTNAKTVTMTVTSDLETDDPCPSQRWGMNTTTSTLTGLGHLEGQSVRVYGDMTDLGDYTVSSGSITLPRAVSVAYAGLTYRSRWKSLKLSYGAQKGTALGMRKAIKAIVAMLYRCGPTVTYGKALGRGLSRSFTKMRDISTRDASVPMGEPLPLFSGEKELSFDAHYDTDSRICLEIDGPAPGTIAGLTLLLDEKDR